jgi:hypothetical protein
MIALTRFLYLVVLNQNETLKQIINLITSILTLTFDTHGMI